MKLWNDGKAGSAGSAIRATVKGQVAKINRQVVARGVRAVNAMRNAELEVLKVREAGEHIANRTAKRPTQLRHQENHRQDVQEISVCTGMAR